MNARHNQGKVLMLIASIVLSTLAAGHVKAELFTDGFDDGNLTENPAWTVVTGSPMVGVDEVESTNNVYKSNSGGLFARLTSQLSNTVTSRVVTLKARVRLHATQGGATTVQLGLTDRSTRHGYIVRAVLYNNGNSSQLGIFPTEDNGETLQAGVNNVLLGPFTLNDSWHDVKLIWNQATGAMSSYWDGALIANNVINVPSQLYNSFNQVVLNGQFNSARVDNVSIALEPQVIVGVLSWYSPLGALNGVDNFQSNGYLYRAQAALGSNIANYPLPLGVEYPNEAPVVGGPEFLHLSQVSALKSLQLMRQASFDVAAFDMLPWPTYQPPSQFEQPRVGDDQPFSHFPVFLRWLQAAPEAKMKVALFADIQNFSGDFPQGRKLTVGEWTNVLKGALDGMKGADGNDLPGVWKLNNKPAIFHFGTDSSTGFAPNLSEPEPDKGWRSILKNVRDSGRSFSFIADIRPRYSNLAEWEEFVDGAYIFGPAAPTGFLKELQPQIASNFQKIPFIWSVSPGYYNASIPAYTQPDFNRIHEAYQAAITAKAPYMFVMTWNDFGEDTDIEPSVNKGSALLTVFRYYNEWFKAGSQPNWKGEDHIVLSYPLRIPQTVYTPLVDWGPYKSPAFKPPKMFYWAWVREPRNLTVDGVGEVKLPQGLSLGEVGEVRSGPISVRLGGGSARVLIPITETVIETQRSREGGLEFRYIDLLHGTRY